MHPPINFESDYKVGSAFMLDLYENFEHALLNTSRP